MDTLLIVNYHYAKLTYSLDNIYSIDVICFIHVDIIVLYKVSILFKFAKLLLQ